MRFLVVPLPETGWEELEARYNVPAREADAAVNYILHVSTAAIAPPPPTLPPPLTPARARAAGAGAVEESEELLAEGRVTPTESSAGPVRAMHSPPGPPVLLPSRSRRAPFSAQVRRARRGRSKQLEANLARRRVRLEEDDEDEYLPTGDGQGGGHVGAALSAAILNDDVRVRSLYIDWDSRHWERTHNMPALFRAGIRELAGYSASVLQATHFPGLLLALRFAIAVEHHARVFSTTESAAAKAVAAANEMAHSRPRRLLRAAAYLNEFPVLLLLPITSANVLTNKYTGADDIFKRAKQLRATPEESIAHVNEAARNARVRFGDTEVNFAEFLAESGFFFNIRGWPTRETVRPPMPTPPLPNDGLHLPPLSPWDGEAPGLPHDALDPIPPTVDYAVFHPRAACPGSHGMFDDI